MASRAAMDGLKFGAGDQRTFAQVAAGATVRSPAFPIPLKTDTLLKSWMGDPVLIGEAHSLDHLSTFYEYSRAGTTTKYLGGLTLALEFDMSTKARNFLEDETNWRDWFKWVKTGVQGNIQYDRIASLKIVGLPLNLWDEANFSSIAAKFGKVVISFESIHNRSDWSMGIVGVLTSRKNWINEVVTVTANGLVFQVGVVEYTDDWSPFKTCSHDKNNMLDDEDDIDDSDGVSDTWANMEEKEAEEGEFIPERIHEDGERKDVVDDNIQNGNDDSELPVTGKDSRGSGGVNEETAQMAACGNVQNVELGTGALGVETTSTGSGANNNHNKWDGIPKLTHPAEREPQAKIGSNNGPEVNLVSLGCFGPFPSLVNQPIEDVGLNSLRPKNRKQKRRRADSGGKSCSPNQNSGHKDSAQTEPIPIDLNSNPRPSLSEAPVMSNGDGTVPVLDEDEVTVAVGVELGFQIEKGDLSRIREEEVIGAATEDQ
ncbi:hypothetical protein L1887_15140 [Cichorium endivia]|nr:hypothetical protein L1887_15140 [Cichorium endivia]